MRTTRTGERGTDTFAGRKRREQLIDCTIDVMVERGFQGASVAEVAQRAGVSKGVVTYHFAAKDDLIFATVAHIFDSITETLQAALSGTSPERFVADYIGGWIGYFETETRSMLALREIWGNFRDEGGEQHFGPDAVEGELGVVRHVFEYGQAEGILAPFDARVMAVSIKAALDALLDQFASDPELDLQAYGAELVALFERATRPTRS